MRDKFNYRLIWRDKELGVYEQSLQSERQSPVYETVVIRRHNGYTVNGVAIEPAEFLPSASEWGILGYTVTNLGSVEKYLDKLAQKIGCKYDKQSLQSAIEKYRSGLEAQTVAQ